MFSKKPIEDDNVFLKQNYAKPPESSADLMTEKQHIGQPSQISTNGNGNSSISNDKSKELAKISPSNAVLSKVKELEMVKDESNQVCKEEQDEEQENKTGNRGGMNDTNGMCSTEINYKEGSKEIEREETNDAIILNEYPRQNVLMLDDYQQNKNANLIPSTSPNSKNSNNIFVAKQRNATVPKQTEASNSKSEEDTVANCNSHHIPEKSTNLLNYAETRSENVRNKKLKRSGLEEYIKPTNLNINENRTVTEPELSKDKQEISKHGGLQAERGHLESRSKR